MLNDSPKVYDFGGDHSIALFDGTTQTVLHKHEFYEFSVMVKDGYFHRINGQELHVEKGDTVLLRPGEIHQLIPTEDKEHLCLNILISSSVFVGVCDDLSKKLHSKISDFPEIICFHLSESIVSSLVERLSEPVFIVAQSMINENQKDVYNQLLKCIAYEMAGYFLKSGFPSDHGFPECIERLLLFLENKENLCLGVSEIASSISYSPSYISRQFHKQFGMTLKQYLINQRLIRAKDLLLNTEFSCERIASETGWGKTANFVSSFKNLYGVSPKKFKESSDKTAD